MGILQYAGIALVSAWMISLFRKNSEFGLGILLAASMLLLWMLADSLAELLNIFKEYADAAGMSSSAFALILKVVGTGYLADLSSRLCRDQGLDALAFQVETAGRILILLSSVPLLEELLQYITGLMEW